MISCSANRVELLQSSPVRRLALDGSPVGLRLLAIAFSCYHALKLGHRDDILSFLESGHPVQVYERLMSYASAFSKEISING